MAGRLLFRLRQAANPCAATVKSTSQLPLVSWSPDLAMQSGVFCSEELPGVVADLGEELLQNLTTRPPDPGRPAMTALTGSWLAGLGVRTVVVRMILSQTRRFVQDPKKFARDSRAQGELWLQPTRSAGVTTWP